MSSDNVSVKKESNSIFKTFDKMMSFVDSSSIANKASIKRRVIRNMLDFGIYFQTTDKLETIGRYLYRGPVDQDLINFIKTIIDDSKHLNLDEEIKNDVIPPHLEGKKYDKIAMSLSIRIHYPLYSHRTVLSKEEFDNLIKKHGKLNNIEFVASYIHSYFVKYGINGQVVSLFSNPPLRYDYDEIKDDSMILLRLETKLFLPYLVNDYIPYICSSRKKITFVIVMRLFNDIPEWALSNKYFVKINIINESYIYSLYEN